MGSVSVLVIAYNKPIQLNNLLQFLSENTNSEIYIHLDGANPESPHWKLNKQCEKLILDFRKKRKNVKVKLNTGNLGGQMGVLSAIDWFFESQSLGLILEEDLLISPLALQFIDENKHLLENEDLFSICLFNPLTEIKSNFMLDHWIPLGWATKDQSWKDYRDRMEDHSMRLRYKSGSSPASRFPVRYYLNNVMRKLEREEIKTWDAPLHILHITKGRKSLFPHQTLSRHLGYGPEATHSGDIDWWAHLVFPKTLSSKTCEGNLITHNIRFEKEWRMSWLTMMSDLFQNLKKKIF